MFILSQLEKVILQASLIPTSNESSPFNLMLAYGVNFFRSKVRHKKGIGSEKGFVMGYVMHLNNKQGSPLSSFLQNEVNSEILT